MSEAALTFWNGIAKLPEDAQKSFWAAGETLSAFIGEPAQPRRLEYDTSRPPAGASWWEELLFYIGQGQYNRAVADMQAAQATTDGAKWLWGALQGDFNKNPTTGQVIAGGIISLVPLVDQACDIRDVVANCLTLQGAQDDDGAWMALGLTCIGFVPEFGSAIKTVAKASFNKGTRLLGLLKHMEWIEANFKRLKVACPWGYAPLEWLRKFDWVGAAKRASDGAKRAFENALRKTETAIKYALGSIKTRLQQLADLFRSIIARLGEKMAELGRRLKARIDELLGNAKKEAGQYGAAAGKAPNTHVQGENPPPPRGPNKPPRMEPHKPKCFRPGDDLKRNWKGDPKKLEKEFYEQLKGQEEGLNKLTIGEYLENRAKFEQIGRGSGAAQANARSHLEEEIFSSVYETLRRSGVGAADAKRQAAAKTDDVMSAIAALHDPDMVAGGYDRVRGFGDRKVNSSIGSQWSNGGRVREMDRAAEDALAKLGPNAQMNVKLERCR